jgi:hypothetical protein
MTTTSAYQIHSEERRPLDCLDNPRQRCKPDRSIVLWGQPGQKPSPRWAEQAVLGAKNCKIYNLQL